MGRLLVIDGNNVICTGNYGIDIKHKEYPEIQIGGLHYLLSKIAFYSLDRDMDIVVCFDSRTNNSQIVENYKSNRIYSKSIAFQVNLGYKILKEYGIPTFKEEGFEADRLIGNTVLANVANYEHVYILSADRDLCALINPKISVMEPKKKGLLINRDNYQDLVNKNTQVPYNTLSYYKMIFGDTSDTVPAISNQKINTLLVEDYIKFCNDSNLDRFYRSFYPYIVSYLKQVNFENIVDVDNQNKLKLILKNRAEVMSVHFNKEEILKHKIPQGFNIKGFVEACKVIGHKNAVNKAKYWSSSIRCDTNKMHIDWNLLVKLFNGFSSVDVIKNEIFNIESAYKAYKRRLAESFELGLLGEEEYNSEIKMIEDKYETQYKKDIEELETDLNGILDTQEYSEFF